MARRSYDVRWSPGPNVILAPTAAGERTDHHHTSQVIVVDSNRDPATGGVAVRRADTDILHTMLMMAIIRVPREGVASFRAYEDSLASLQAEHGATMERCVRTADGTTEVHLMRFPSHEAFAAYMDDPRRSEHRRLFSASGAAMQAFEVEDVAT